MLGPGTVHVQVRRAQIRRCATSAPAHLTMRRAHRSHNTVVRTGDSPPQSAPADDPQGPRFVGRSWDQLAKQAFASRTHGIQRRSGLSRDRSTTGRLDCRPRPRGCVRLIRAARRVAGRARPSPPRRRCPRPRVEAALVPDPAVDFEHALPMVEHVAGERPRERILIAGIDVDLHDSERDRVRKIMLAGSAAAIKHILERASGYATASACRPACRISGRRTTLPGA